MKPIVKGLLLVVASVQFISCSKDSGNSGTTSNGKSYCPKAISLTYGSGQTVRYQFSYNSENQLDQMEMERNSSGGTSRLVTHFNYTGTGLLSSVSSEDVQGGEQYDFSFEHDAEGNITDIGLIVDNTAYDLSISHYGEEGNRYLVEGDLGNLPTEWGFDTYGQLVKIAIAGNANALQLSETDKGIFHDLDPQTAMVVWHGLMFYLTPFELYFFSQDDIVQINTDDATYLFQNKVWDGNGNLISFQIRTDFLSGPVMDYVVEYETINP